MDRLVFIAKGLLVINIAFALSFSTLAVEPGYFDGAYSGALRGIFSSKNALGSIIAVAYAILFIDLLQTPKRYKFIPFLWLCAAMIILVLTQSATAIIAALFTTMIGTVSSAEWFLRSKQVTRLTFLLFLFFIFGLLASLIEPILGLLGRDLTLTGRSFLWLYAYENIQLKPIFGHGLNSFWREMLSKNQLVEVGLWNIGQAHNGFIDAFLSGGIVGGLIIIAVYLKMLAVLIKEITKQPISTRLTELLVFYWLALVQNLTETSFPYSMRLTGVIITLFFILHASRYEEDNIEG